MHLVDHQQHIPPTHRPARPSTAWRSARWRPPSSQTRFRSPRSAGETRARPLRLRSAFGAEATVGREPRSRPARTATPISTLRSPGGVPLRKPGIGRDQCSADREPDQAGTAPRWNRSGPRSRPYQRIDVRAPGCPATLVLAQTPWGTTSGHAGTTPGQPLWGRTPRRADGVVPLEGPPDLGRTPALNAGPVYRTPMMGQTGTEQLVESCSPNQQLVQADASDHLLTRARPEDRLEVAFGRAAPLHGLRPP